MTGDSKQGDRIAKVIARAGLASRRAAEVMVTEGRVTLNGKPVTDVATNVAPRDRIAVDGKALPAPDGARLWLYHKPAGLVTSAKDEKGRPTVFDALPSELGRVLSVGRLDLNSEGLLLLTNDGALKRQLELPSTGWLRRYRVRVNGAVDDAQLAALRDGIEVEGDRFAPMQVELDRQKGANAWLTVGLREGRNREIRRAMAALELYVNRLIRVSYGPFQLGKLEAGEVEEVRPRILREQLGATFDGDLAEAAKGTAAPARADGKRSQDRGAPAKGARRGDAPKGRGPKGRPDRGEGGADARPWKSKPGGRGSRDGARPDRESAGAKPARKGGPRHEGGPGDDRAGRFGKPARGASPDRKQRPGQGGHDKGPRRDGPGGDRPRTGKPPAPRDGAERPSRPLQGGGYDKGARRDGPGEDRPRTGKPPARRDGAERKPRPAQGAGYDKGARRDGPERDRPRTGKPPARRDGPERTSQNRSYDKGARRDGPGGDRPRTGKPPINRGSAGRRPGPGEDDAARETKAERTARLRADTSVSLRKGGQRGKGIAKAKKKPSGKTLRKPKDGDGS